MSDERAAGERAPAHPDGRAPAAEQSRRRWIVAMTLVAVPATLALESGVRMLVASDDLEAIGAMLAPTTTLVAWALCALTALASVTALALGLRLAARRKLGVGSFLLVASLAQAPAMLSVLTPLVGASLEPVLLAVGISTLAVVLLALRLRAAR